MQWCFSQVKGAIDDDVAEGMSSAKNVVFISITHRWEKGGKILLVLGSIQQLAVIEQIAA